MATRTKLSYNFPRFFESATSGAQLDPSVAVAFRNLIRELEKLHIETARILNLTVGDIDWTAVSSFTNSWANTGGSEPGASYIKVNHDIVLLKGAIDSGTIGAAAFTLPTGYRPAETQHFAVDRNGAYGRLTVNSSGEVIPQTTAAAGYHLNGVIFRADG